MAKSISASAKRRGRPVTTGTGTTIGVRMLDDRIDALDRWISKQGEQPLHTGDGGGFLATVPDLPGCMSDGETPQEALAGVQDAIVCWIEEARELGRAIPDPTAPQQPDFLRRAG
jgi:antitoxin HicB